MESLSLFLQIMEMFTFTPWFHRSLLISFYSWQTLYKSNCTHIETIKTNFSATSFFYSEDYGLLFKSTDDLRVYSLEHFSMFSSSFT